jgi:hypothetical protein
MHNDLEGNLNWGIHERVVDVGSKTCTYISYKEPTRRQNSLFCSTSVYGRVVLQPLFDRNRSVQYNGDGN